MAITQVRANFNGVWYTLSLDESGKYYRASIVPPASSSGQSGGYYNVSVEVQNDSGSTIATDGSLFKTLRLVVKEGVPPGVALVSPAEGFLTAASQSFVFDVTDTGSGIDLSTVQVQVDGTVRPHTAAAISNGYRVSCPASGLGEGAHTVTVSVLDHDGNQGTLTAAYTVDTQPPELQVFYNNLRRVVDGERVTLTGTVRDATSGLSSVTVSGPGGVRAVGPGVFAVDFPLLVGVNDITVTAADHAGLVKQETFRVVRLITDRAQADVDRLAAVLVKQWSDFSEAEKAAFLAGPRGGYGHGDLNRVAEAEALLKQLLTEVGYLISGSYKTNWAAGDVPTGTDLADYLSDVTEIRDAIPVEQALPETMGQLQWTGANQIEAALVRVDAVLPVLQASFIASGEASCGEF